MIATWLLGLAFAAEPPPVAVPPSSAKTPLVLSVSGPAELMTGRDTELRPAKPRIRLMEKAVLKTGPGGEIRLQLDGARLLRLGPSTRIELPGIRWEGGEVPQVLLTEGRLRWQAAPAAAAVTLRTKLFELSPEAGDFLFTYDPSSPRAQVDVFAGQIVFMATNSEDSVKVGARQKASFQGVLEDGDIAADILLHGRRVPRGKLSAAEPLTAAELGPVENEEKNRLAAEKKKAAEKKRHDVAEARAGVICAAPKALFNECAWERRKGACVRRRCNANGRWAEDTVLAGDQAARCKAAAVVGACDY